MSRLEHPRATVKLEGLCCIKCESGTDEQLAISIWRGSDRDDKSEVKGGKKEGRPLNVCSQSVVKRALAQEEEENVAFVLSQLSKEGYSERLQDVARDMERK